jgi:hypothetical protein
VSNPDWPAPYTAMDFILDSIDQSRRMGDALEAWEREFLADQKRMEEWSCTK